MAGSRGLSGGLRHEPKRQCYQERSEYPAPGIEHCITSPSSVGRECITEAGRILSNRVYQGPRRVQCMLVLQVIVISPSALRLAASSAKLLALDVLKSLSTSYLTSSNTAS